MIKPLKLAKKAIHHAILIVLAALWLIPVYAMLIDGMKSAGGVLTTPILQPTGLSFTSLIEVSTALELPIVNSLIISVTTATVSTLIGALAAFYFYKGRSWTNNSVFVIIAIATFIPYQITLVPVTEILSTLGLFNTYPGLIFTFVIFHLPGGALLMTIFMSNLPKSIIESARADGAGDWAVFSRVAFPLTLAGAVSTFILTFVEVWNNFFIPLVLTSTPNMYTASISLLSYTGGYGTLYNDSFAAALVASLIPLLVFVILGRYFMRGFLALGSGSKG